MIQDVTALPPTAVVPVSAMTRADIDAVTQDEIEAARDACDVAANHLRALVMRAGPRYMRARNDVVRLCRDTAMADLTPEPEAWYESPPAYPSDDVPF